MEGPAVSIAARRIHGLGFYSEIARRHVVKAREIIAARGYGSTHDDIRRFRQDLVPRTKASTEL